MMPDIIDADFKIHKEAPSILSSKDEKPKYAKYRSGGFGFKTKDGGFFKSAGKNLKKADKAIHNATQKTVEAGERGLAFQKKARANVHEARTTHLRRKQEISEYKTNILNLKHQKQIHKSNIISAKLSQVEQKRALAESKAQGRTSRKSYRGLSDSFVPKQKKSSGAFFAGVKKSGINKSNGGFFAGAGNLNKPRKKGGFFN